MLDVLIDKVMRKLLLTPITFVVAVRVNWDEPEFISVVSAHDRVDAVRKLKKLYGDIAAVEFLKEVM